MEKYYCLQKPFIYSDAEKNSASNELTPKVFSTDIKNLIGEKLVFRPILNAQDFSYYSRNFEK